MLHSRHSRFFLCALVAVALAMPLHGAAIHYVAETIVAGDAGQTGLGEMTVEAWINGVNGHIKVLESSNPLMPPGNYMVTNDGARTIYLVDPEAKTYAKFDVDGIVQFAGSILDKLGPIAKVEFSDPIVETISDESSDSRFGYRTRRVRTKTTYDMNMRVVGIRRVQEVETDQEVVVAPDLDAAAFGAWLRSDPPVSGNEDFDAMLAASAIQPDGVPLEVITVTTNRTYNRKRTKVTEETSSKTVMKVRELGEASDEGIPYTVPEDFTETSLLMGTTTSENGGFMERLRGASRNTEDDG